MTGYFGTPAQQDLQRRNHKLQEWVATTPGLYNAGRLIGCDDVERVPLPTLEDIFERDGLLGFRMMAHSSVAPRVEHFTNSGARVDHWDVFVGEAEHALKIVLPILDEDGDTGVTLHAEPGDTKATREIQEFSARNGVSPFPGYLLSRPPPDAVTLVQRSDNGEILSVGHAYFPHNSHSPLARYAWVGMISVAERARGFGLGRHMNAALVRAAFRSLGASHVVEMAAHDNFASRKMIEACGIAHRPDLACCVVSRPESERVTR